MRARLALQVVAASSKQQARSKQPKGGKAMRRKWRVRPAHASEEGRRGGEGTRDVWCKVCRKRRKSERIELARLKKFTSEPAKCYDDVQDRCTHARTHAGRDGQRKGGVGGKQAN